MPRPWEEKNYTEEELLKEWGPAKSTSGVTREEFYDKMVEQGWNKPGDDNSIAALWCHACEHEKQYRPEKPNLSKEIMDMNVTDDIGPRGKTDYSKKIDVLHFASNYYGVEAIIGAQTPIEKERARFAFIREMSDSGWKKDDDREVLNVIEKYAHDGFVDKSSGKSFRSTLYVYRGNTSFGRKQAIEAILDEEKKGIFKIAEEDKKVLDEELKRIDVLQKEEKARLEEERKLNDPNKVLRSYFNKIMELGLDEFEFDFQAADDWAAYEKYKDLTGDAKKITDAEAGIDSLPIDEELLKKTPDEAKEALKESFKNMMEGIFGDDESLTDLESLSYADFSDHLTSPDDLKAYLKDAVKEAVKTAAIAEAGEKDREENPDYYLRADNISKTLSKLNTIVKALKYYNQSFQNAAKNKQDTSKIELNTNFALLKMLGVENDSPASQKELLAAIEHIAQVKATKSTDLMTKDTLEKDLFWNNYSRALTTDEIRKMQEKFAEISETGFDWDEFVNSGGYEQFLETQNIQMNGNFDPLELARFSKSGPEAEKQFQTRVSVANYEQAMDCLDKINAEYQAKKDAIYNIDSADKLGEWFTKNGYDMLENSMLVVNGIDEKIINGETFKVINLSNEIDVEKLDRDKLSMDEYKEMIQKAKDAQKLYEENKEDFQNVFHVMSYKEDRFGEYQPYQVRNRMDKITDDKELIGKINQFRHTLYELKRADQNVCKLINVKKNNEPVSVEPLEADTKFDAQMVYNEKQILDIVYDMLKDPTTRTHRDSSEYKKIMSDVLKVKEVLSNTYASNEEARRAYVKSINNVLKDINIYRKHKADTTVKEDATLDKLVALERVDKLLRTRYQSVERRVYEDDLGGVAELFDINVAEDKFGNDYLLDKARQKINNMNKSIDELKAEMELEEGPIKRSNSFSGAPLDAGKLDQQEEIKVEAPKEEIKIEEQKEEIKIEEAKEEIKIEEPKEEIKIEEPKAEAVDFMKHPMAAAANKIEADYRKTLDPNDSFGKEKLLSSAIKTLYAASIIGACERKVKELGAEKATGLLENGMRDLAKANSVQFAKFKFQVLTDKDFNKEFEKGVIEAAKEGKTSAEDILKCRDNALKACYTAYKGKVTKDLDKLSHDIGSKINSKSPEVKVEGNKLDTKVIPVTTAE
jgi:hypothetical protein